MYLQLTNEELELVKSALPSLGTFGQPILDKIQQCEEALADPRYSAYVIQAKSHHEEGDLEVDDEPHVAFGEDPGAYVMCWKWIDAEDAGLPGPQPSKELLAFFAVESRNENDGGVRPATLDSAMDSAKQAPDDVFLEWCEADPNDYTDVDNTQFTEANLAKHFRDELAALAAYYGTAEELATFLVVKV